ncbi:MAG: ABC transporter permease [Deltaproteobacteria bacterium]|nr:ABC transporter permease [Deltaproteobacteria bacterium]
MNNFLAQYFLKSFGSLTSPWIRRLSLGGLSLSLALLLITQGVFGGFEKIFKESLQSFNAHLVALNYGNFPEKNLREVLTPEFEKELVSLNPFTYTESLLLSQGKIRGLSLKGLDLKSLDKIKYLKLYNNKLIEVHEIKDIFLNKNSDLPALILGKDLVEALQLKPGQQVKLFRASDLASLDSPRNFQAFVFLGAFETGLKDFDSAFALVDLEVLQSLWPEAGLSQGWEIRLKNPDRALYWQDFFQENEASSLFHWISWQKLNEPILKALRYDRLVFFFIMALVVLVALASLAGFLALMVLERDQDLQLLYFLGVSKSKINRLFERVAFFFSLKALFWALIFGLGVLWLLRYGFWSLSKEVYRVDHVPVELSWSLVLLLVTFSLLLSWLVVRFSLGRIFKKLELQSSKNLVSRSD